MIPLVLFALFVITFWLSLYTYGMFCVGRWFADRYRLRVSKQLAVLIFASASVVLAAPALLVDTGHIYKLTLAFGIWLIHTQPTAVGYWSTCEKRRIEDETRWQKTVDSWLEPFDESGSLTEHDLDGGT